MNSFLTNIQIYFMYETLIFYKKTKSLFKSSSKFYKKIYRTVHSHLNKFKTSRKKEPGKNMISFH